MTSDAVVTPAAPPVGRTPDEIALAHVRLARRRLAVLAALAGLLGLLAVADAVIGGAPMPLETLVGAIVDPAGALPIDRQIVWDIRRPMTATAVVVGASLAVAGAVMQTALGNPLAEPYTLGISSAAGFGAALAVVTGFASTGIGAFIGVSGSAWLFAMLATGIILTAARLRGRGTEGMILVGIAVVFLFTALLHLMQYVASAMQLEQVVFWTLGSLTRATWPQIGMAALVLLVCGILLGRRSWTLTCLQLGDERARALGIPVGRVRTTVLVMSALLAATGVAIAGTIGFIGLVGPHIARLLLGGDQRYLLAGAALCGSLLLVGASLAAKLIQPGVILPVGIITAIIGVPVFLAVIMRTRAVGRG